MVEMANFKGTQSPSTAHGRHVQCLEISFLWHRLNLELQMDQQKFLQSSVLTEIILMSVFILYMIIRVPAAWASRWVFFFFPRNGDGQSVLARGAHGWAGAARPGILAPWAAEASHALHWGLLCLQALTLLYFLLNGCFPQRQSF